MDASGANGRNGLLWGLAAAGVIAFVWGALSADPRATWGIYLVNLLAASIRIASVPSTLGPHSESAVPRWPSR